MTRLLSLQCDLSCLVKLRRDRNISRLIVFNEVVALFMKVRHERKRADWTVTRFASDIDMETDPKCLSGIQL